MVLYEITASVDDAIADKFYNYLASEHVSDLLETGLFEKAILGRRENEIKVVYYAQSRASLDEYFRSHAEGLRGKVLERFPDGVSIARAEWEDVHILTPPVRNGTL